MPRPQMLQMTITATAMTATSQLVWQLVIAELARIKPMEMTMGPVTTGGKKRMTRLAPNARNRAASTG